MAQKWVKEWSRGMKVQKAVAYAISIYKPFQRMLGTGMPISLYVSRGQALDFYYLEEDRKRFTDFMKKRLQSDEPFLRFLLSDYKKMFEPHLEFLKSLQKKDLTALPNEQLWEYFSEFKKSLNDYVGIMSLIVHIEKPIEEAVLHALRKADSSRIDSDALTVFSLTEKNYLAREEWALYQIFLLPQSEQQKALQAHTKRFSYIPMYDYDYEPYPAKHFQKRLEEIRLDNGKKIVERHAQFEKNKIAFEKLIKKLKLSESDELVLAGMHFLFNQKDERSHFRSWDSFFGQKLYAEIGKRTSYPLQDLMMMLDSEIRTAMLENRKTELAERKKEMILTVDREKPELLTGQKMRDFLAKNLAEEKKREITGLSVSPGVVKGIARIILHTSELSKVTQGDIMVTPMTRPDFVTMMKKCAAIVTDEGGVLCHAAIVSRELLIPCVVGTKSATTTIKDGDTIEVDAIKGIVRIL